MSPDLEVRVTAASMNRAAARQIANSQWPFDALAVSAPEPVLSRWMRRDATQGELFIGAHDILDDAADWNASTWLFDPTQLHRLAATLRRLFELMPVEFELIASWAGDDPAREQPITRTELMRIVSLNQLGNAVRYRVSAG